VDKAEDLLSEYFKKYGNYILTYDETEKLGLTLLKKEVENVANLYQSHRLYVYQSCLTVFHRLYMESSLEDPNDPDADSIEAIFLKIENIFTTYNLDSIYYHLKIVFDFLKLEYYLRINQQRKADKYFDEINEDAPVFVMNYNLYTFSPQFLLTKLERHLKQDTAKLLYEENKALFEDFEIDKNNTAQYIIYVTYRAVSCYYADKYDEAAKWINNLLNDLSLKKIPNVLLELKLFLALQYALKKEDDLFIQLVNSIQRQIRIMGKQNCTHILLFTKVLKISLNEVKKSKPSKVQTYLNRLNKDAFTKVTPIKYLKFDEDFISRLT